MIPVRDTTGSRGLAPLTIALILVNIVVFVEELRLGPEIADLYSVSPKDIYTYLTKGTSGFLSIHARILASGFIHGGYIHIFGNLLFLYVFGPPVERRLGSMRFGVFYLLSIFIAFYSHTIVFTQSDIPLIGASGAIAAVMGAYLVLFPRARIVTVVPIFFIIKIIEVPSALFMSGWFILQWANGYASISSQSTVAWFSHIGGFLTGFATAVQFRWFR